MYFCTQIEEYIKTMRIKSFLSLSLCAFLAACGGGHDDHEGHDHEHEGHDHETEQHDEHDHDHGHEDEHHHEGSIKLDEHQVKEFGVVTQTLVPGSFSQVVKVSGAVEPASTDRVTITATRSGIFTLSRGLTVGSRVGAGAAIGSISSKGLQGGDPNAVAAATVEATRREVERLKSLLKDGLVTEAQYNEAVRAYNEARAASGGVSGGSGSVVSPATGTLSELFVTPGQYVEVGAPIAVVVRSSRLTLRADVPQRYASSVPALVSANFRTDSSGKVYSLSELGGRPLAPGTVNSIRNGYMPVYFTFESIGEIIPGSFAEIFLTGAPRQGVLSVPREALIEMQGNCYAYVRVHGHEGVFEKRLVKTGASDGINVEILEGLGENDEVVVKGASVVRMAETSAIAPPGHTHNH